MLKEGEMRRRQMNTLSTVYDIVTISLTVVIVAGISILS